MQSKRSHEGYFCLDHRASPGVSDAVLMKEGLVAGAGHGLFESASFTCSHCEAVVVKNPDRSRERAWCKKCDHYLCDRCGSVLQQTGICYPFKAMAQDILNLQDKRPVDSIPLQPADLSPEINQAISNIFTP